MNDGRAIEVPGFDGIGPLTTWAIVVFGRPRYLPYSALPQYERPHSEGTEVIPMPEPLPDKPRIAGGFYMEQTALANRLCRPSLLHLEPVAFPSHLPTTPTQRSNATGRRPGTARRGNPFRGFRRRDSGTGDELPERVFSKWREISHGFGL